MAENNDNESVVSPIQMVDIVGTNDGGELQPVAVELLREIAEQSNARSAILITFEEVPLQGKRQKFEVSSINLAPQLFTPALELIITALGGRVPQRKPTEPGQE